VEDGEDEEEAPTNKKAFGQTNKLDKGKFILHGLDQVNEQILEASAQKELSEVPSTASFKTAEIQAQKSKYLDSTYFHALGSIGLPSSQLKRSASRNSQTFSIAKSLKLKSYKMSSDENNSNTKLSIITSKMILQKPLPSKFLGLF
jgi:hypothetical protein